MMRENPESFLSPAPFQGDEDPAELNMAHLSWTPPWKLPLLTLPHPPGALHLSQGFTFDRAAPPRILRDPALETTLQKACEDHQLPNSGPGPPQ